MSAFAAAINAIFADPNMAWDALWRRGGGGPGVQVRVIRRAPDDTVRFGEGRFLAETVLLDVRVAEAPELARGDTLERLTDGEIFEIIGAPARDREQLVWRAEARSP